MSRPPSKTNYVISELVSSLRSGEFKSGDKLPSMRVLGEKFGVSTMVMHQAVSRLEREGLVVSGARSGIYVPEHRRQLDLCGFISPVRFGTMDHYYESFMKSCSSAGCVAMTVSGDFCDIEAMVEKKPLRLYVDVGSKDLSYKEILSLTSGIETIFCNRFEYVDQRPESGVLTDWHYITEMTLRYFLERGHRRILFVSHDPVIREFKRRELESSAKRVGLTFESPEFQWCSFKDFQDNPSRLVHMYRHNPPTAIFARGDNPLYEFIRKAASFFPDAPRPECIGAFNSVWSNLPDMEFASWQWDWEAFWNQVFAHTTKDVEFYRPKLLLKSATKGG